MLVLAHPLTEPGELLLPPIAVVTLVASIVALVAQGRVRTGAAGTVPTPPLLLDRRLTPRDLVGRTVGVVLLVASVLAGRLGAASEVDNLAAVLVVAFAWPALVVGQAVWPTLWPRLNPWDGLARVLGTRNGAPGEDVRWALPAAFAWVAYLGLLQRPLAPRSVSAALAIYTTATIAGCVAVGRVRWLSTGEVFTVFFGWIGKHSGLVDWQPPRGAAALLGVLGGGLVFTTLRASELWVPLVFSTGWSWVGLLTACLAVVGLLTTCEHRAARAGAPGAVVAAAVPPLAALAVVAALVHNRLFVSAQLLPFALADPFGSGLDPLGIGPPRIEPEPLGVSGLLLLQLGLLLVGHVLGALVGRRRATPAAGGPGTRSARGAVTVALTVLGAAGALAVATV